MMADNVGDVYALRSFKSKRGIYTQSGESVRVEGGGRKKCRDYALSHFEL